MLEKRITAQQKRAVFERAEGCCEYCRSQVRFAVQPFSIEHIVPRSRGGKTNMDNLALACQGCNNHKYTTVHGRDPVTGEIVPIYHSRHQQWSDHFAWSEDCTLIIGLTPTGRTTVEVLCLNRKGLVNLRRILYVAGAHPPITNQYD